MGRIGKIKRLLIEETNKKLLGESIVDIDTVLTDMKYKFGYGDMSPMWLEEFEEHMGEDLINQLSTNEYTDLFSDWMNSKRIGSDEDVVNEGKKKKYEPINEDVGSFLLTAMGVYSFYKFKFSTWDYVVLRHKLSFVNLAKMLLSKVFRRHHYYDCLNTDLAKLYLCLAIGNPDDGSLAKSKRYFSMITSVKSSQLPSPNLRQYIEQLILSDKNAQMFFERGSDIFYE